MSPAPPARAALPGTARTGDGLLLGALLGALGGVLLAALGLRQVAGLQQDATVVVAAAVAGAALGWIGFTRWLAWLDGLLLATAVLVAFVPWTGAMDRWVRADPLPDHPVGAIVVLSSGLSADSSLTGSGPDRLLAGLELFQRGVAPRIVTTRLVWSFGGVETTSDADQRRLVHLAGADSAWLVADSIETTRGEATSSARLLQPLGVREIVLVTSPSHTRRACGAFEKVGFLVHCFPARERVSVTWHAGGPDDRLSVFGALVYELLGTVKYEASGWM